MPVDSRFFASVGAVTLAKWAEMTGATLMGDPEAEATGVSSSASAQAGDVCFYEGKPADDGNGITISMTITGKLEDAVDRCKGVGGKMVTEIRTIPYGRYACFVNHIKCIF